MEQEKYEIKRPDSFKRRKRIGCGTSSGHGKTSCRGQKGQGSRSGSSSRPWFEGGQMPLQRRIPKRGFKNFTRKVFQIVQLSTIEKLGLVEINAQILADKGVVAKADMPIKILGNGEISRAVSISADAFTASAMEKIQKAGGTAVKREHPIKMKTVVQGK